MIFNHATYEKAPVASGRLSFRVFRGSLHLLLFLALSLTTFAGGMDSKSAPSQSSSSTKPAAPKMNYNQGPPVKPGVSATAIDTGNATADSPESGHLGFSLTGVATVSAKMVDPYRILGGVTNIVGAGWITFSGVVLSIQPEGVRLNGTYTPVPKTDEVYTGEFFVANYPYPCTEGDIVGTSSRWYYAKLAGTCIYTNPIGFSHTLRLLDYGEPWIPGPPTPEQLAARKKLKDEAKAAEDERKKAITARVVKANQEAADRGDVIGLLRMGERYRDGKGVERDLAKARDYLQRAAEKGSATAQDELEMLKLAK